MICGGIKRLVGGEGGEWCWWLTVDDMCNLLALGSGPGREVISVAYDEDGGTVVLI